MSEEKINACFFWERCEGSTCPPPSSGGRCHNTPCRQQYVQREASFKWTFVPPPSFSFFFKEILSQDPDYSLLVQDFRSAFVRPRQAQNYYYYSWKHFVISTLVFLKYAVGKKRRNKSRRRKENVDIFVLSSRKKCVEGSGESTNTLSWCLSSSVFVSSRVSVTKTSNFMFGVRVKALRKRLKTEECLKAAVPPPRSRCSAARTLCRLRLHAK